MDPMLLDIPDEFESERLTIRVPRAGDGPEVNAAVLESISELRPWMPWAQTIPSIEESELQGRKARASFMVREDIQLRLFLKGTNILVGSSGLHRMDWAVPRFEIGYWMRTSYQGKGYCTEAVLAIERFAFETLKARRVEIRMNDKNVRSWKVAERAGYPLEGILRNESLDVGGAIRDTRVYAKVR